MIRTQYTKRLQSAQSVTDVAHSEYTERSSGAKNKIKKWMALMRFVNSYYL